MAASSRCHREKVELATTMTEPFSSASSLALHYLELEHGGGQQTSRCGGGRNKARRAEGYQARGWPKATKRGSVGNQA
jgi:hypothetical protein